MRDLSSKARVAITLATALVLGAGTYGNMFHSDVVWEASFLVVYLLAVGGVFVVYRWWALLPALLPGLVNAYVRNFTDYVAPWREETWGFSDYPFWFVALIAVAILLQVAFLAVGLLARALWERRRAKRRGRTLFRRSVAAISLPAAGVTTRTRRPVRHRWRAAPSRATGGRQLPLTSA